MVNSVNQNALVFQMVLTLHINIWSAERVRPDTSSTDDERNTSREILAQHCSVDVNFYAGPGEIRSRWLVDFQQRGFGPRYDGCDWSVETDVAFGREYIVCRCLWLDVARTGWFCWNDVRGYFSKW